MIKEINAKDITAAVSNAFIKANLKLPEGISKSISTAYEKEKSVLCKEVLLDLIENQKAANKLSIPICQDTGQAVVFADVGQDVHIIGGDFETAINAGVKDGYQKGYLRKSIVKDPLRRENTEDNTPCIIHLRIVPGNKIKIIAAPKGFGSENMSALRMFKPTESADNITEFVKETVIKAGSNPCPPILIGVGIGGNFEYSALLSKRALLKDPTLPHTDPFYEELSIKMLEAVNSTGIGSGGFGGDITALGVNIEAAPTHIAGLPVSVCICCHVSRHFEVEI